MGVPDQNRLRWIRVRVSILVIALLIGFAAIAKGAWDLGIVRRDELRHLAEEQYKRRITIPARRGMITDRHGEELAVEVEVESVYVNSRIVLKPYAAASKLADILGIAEEKLRRKLLSNRHFVWLKRRITPTQADRVRKLDIEGVFLIKESKRFYPSLNLAAHVLGFAGLDAVGLEGIELKFEEQLKGRKDAVLGLRDARGRVVFADSVFGPEGVVGNTVELTIDRTLQYIAEHELEATIRTFNAKAGHVIVMDPKTGEILALANWPGFNPNDFVKSKPNQRRNRAVLDVFEPGSIFKVFTLAAALNSSAIRPDERIFCERGQMTMGDQAKVVIHDDHRDGFLTPNQCLKRSSNICFAKISLEIGKRRFYHYLRRFGFGDTTHVDLPYEAAGIVRHFDQARNVDAAMAGFGQGVGVTSIQIAAALSAIANGGVLMRPMLVRRIVGPDGKTVRSFSPEYRRRVISRYTARLVGDIMTSVTETGGTGTEGALDEFLVAGKTGTAQKADGAKGYAEDKWVASFVGFVPAERPRLVITVVVDEPLINHYGGTVAAPTLRRIADQSLKYLGVAPEKRRRSLKSAKKKPNRVPVEENEPDNDTPENDLDFTTEQAVTELKPGEIITPDLLGMTMKEVMEHLSVISLRPTFQGTGFAVEQMPRPGEPIDRGGFIQLNFAPQLKQKEPQDEEIGALTDESPESATDNDNHF